MYLNQRNELFLIVYDVQHGSCTYMKTPNGANYMFDLGTGSIKDFNFTFSPLLHLKKHWGVNYYQMITVTHPHKDHIDDILNFDNNNVAAFCRPRHLDEQSIRGGNRSDYESNLLIDRYLWLDSIYRTPIPIDASPLIPVNNGGVGILQFTPTKCGLSNLNNHSVVTIVTYAGSKIMIPGDNENVSWEELLENPLFVLAIKNTNVLIAPHHGRLAGYSDALFEHIKPSLVIISDGPAGETSATGRYYNSTTTEGWEVRHTRTNTMERRWTLTTRQDKSVRVRCYIEGGKNFLSVEVD